MQNPQKFCLQNNRHIAYLVKEDGASVALLEL